MKKSALKTIFDLVAKTRDDAGFRIKFSPLSPSKAARLENLVEKALAEEKVQNNPALRSTLQEASRAFEGYNAIPPLVDVDVSVTRGRFGLYSEVVGHKTVKNEDRTQAVKKIQHKLYDGLLGKV